ncbi:MAG: hypothetical protein COB02_15670 [Candidatus Cloacimonadota bacterium]|nr:MAG: hypothetical protein COB02_15670 [Candidatus Cloacimonadota bacterium]
MGRNIEFNKQEVQNKAMNLFWKKGYESTSLSDLLTEMRLSKSSFYQTFQSKHILFESCLSYYAKSLIEDIVFEYKESLNSFLFFEKFLNDIANNTQSEIGQKGCLLMNTATEFSQRDILLSKIVDQSLKKIETTFIKIIMKGQFENNLSKTISPETLAPFLMTIICGLKSRSKAGVSKNILLTTVNITLELIQEKN